jgi:hypothetical protein
LHQHNISKQGEGAHGGLNYCCALAYADGQPLPGSQCVQVPFSQYTHPPLQCGTVQLFRVSQLELEVQAVGKSVGAGQGKGILRPQGALPRFQVASAQCLCFCKLASISCEHRIL